MDANHAVNPKTACPEGQTGNYVNSAEDALIIPIGKVMIDMITRRDSYYTSCSFDC